MAQKQNQRRFLNLYVLPVVVCILICVLAHLLVEQFGLDKPDRIIGCFIGVGTGIGIYTWNKSGINNK
jgi:hypothetical protein